MAKTSSKARGFGAKFRTVNLARHFNWPKGRPASAWWKELAEKVRAYPTGRQQPWGVPFKMAGGRGARVLSVSGGNREAKIQLDAKAAYLCFLHAWEQIPETIRREDPAEGLVIGEYELVYADGTSHVQPVRARFEVAMAESPGPPWLARFYEMWESVDPAVPHGEMSWGRAQIGVRGGGGRPLVYAMPNPHPDRKIRALVVRGFADSPLLVAGLTLFRGGGHPLKHLPRRTYRVQAGKKPPRVRKAEVDLGGVARIERTSGPRDQKWLESPHAGLHVEEPERGGEDLIEAYGAEDASVSVRLEGREKSLKFSLGEAFHGGRSSAGKASLEVLGRDRQWMQVRVTDGATGKPTPVRAHFSGPRGEYLAPYGHHSQVNTNWFEDYGADVVVGGRNFAYVPGEFTTDLPVGDVYVELFKGFEYQPVRRKVTVRPGEKVLELAIDRWKDLRSAGWVTADTHVHFLSPQTAWLEGQAEGVNVVNLLASQWGRLFTNVGDLTGRVGVVEDDTIVYVGTENRNHMLGHMSMLGTKGLPVFPMCCGNPGEAYIADPEFLCLAEWAMENRRKGGLVVRPHYPYCGHTEDPVPILKGLVDALEVNPTRDGGFPIQEWYRYLNCGYRVAVCGGTDKMGAYTALGWLRTYARLDPGRSFDYGSWVEAVRAGRTVSTNGPLLDLFVEGQGIGDTVKLPRSGAVLEARATAECYAPLGRLELVSGGQVIATESSGPGTRRLEVSAKVRMPSSGWIAARCWGPGEGPGSYLAAHTSPVYVQCGSDRAFDGPAAEHMLALVEGGIEYMNTLATHFDEKSRRRMVKLFNEAREELRGRLIVEADGHHHGDGPYHTHGHGAEAGHSH